MLAPNIEMSVSEISSDAVFRELQPNVLKFRGDWAIIGVYQPSEVVSYNNLMYVCLQRNTIAVDPATGAAANPPSWEPVASSSATGGVPSVNGITSAVSIVGSSGVSVSQSASTITISGGSGPTPSGGVTSLNSLTGPLTVAGTGAATVSAAASTITVSVAPNGFVMGGTPTYQNTVTVGTGATAGNVVVFDTSTWPEGLYACVVLGTVGGSGTPDTANSPICGSFMLTKWGWFNAPVPISFGTGLAGAGTTTQRYVLGPFQGYVTPPTGSATAVGPIDLYYGGTNYDQLIAEAPTNSVTCILQCVAYRIA